MIQVLSALSRSYSKRLHTNNNSSKVFLFRTWKCGSVVQKRWERNGHLGDLGEYCKSVPFLQKSSTRYFLWEIHKSLLSWLIAPKVLLESLWPMKTIRPNSSHSHIALKTTSHELRWNKMRQDAPRWSKMHWETEVFNFLPFLRFINLALKLKS